MKLLSPILLLFCFTPIFSQQPAFDFIEKLSNQEALQAQQKLNATENAYTANYNIIYQRCNWKLNPDTLFISGSITSYFIPTENNFQQIQFDCSDSLIIDSILYHQTIITLHQPFKNILKIDLPVIAMGNKDSISVFYHGIPHSNGFGSFTKDQHNGVNIISTLSEPYGALDWWPCKQSLTDKIDSADFFITTPDTMHAGCNGILVDSIFQNGFAIWHWKTHYPIATYLIGFAVTNYDQFAYHIQLNADSVLLLNYVYPEYYQQAQIDVQPITDAMQLYDSIFVTYPFAKEKYGHMQFNWAGGMEHQTMSSMYNLSFELVVHEMAHQWFGDKITCASWHDIWLNESFATYLTDLCYEYLLNGVWWNSWKTQTINHIISQPNGSVYCDDTTNVNRIFSSVLSYRKGSYLLHMLRWELGDDAFFTGIKNYLNDPSLAYGFATTDDLKSHLEQACGHSLNSFFNKWFYGEGWPSYHIEWSQSSDQVFQIRINQSTSDSSVKFFPLHVPIEVKGNGIDTVLVFDNTYSAQSFSVHLNSKVDTVLFDPNLELLSGNNSVVRLPSVETGSQIFEWPNPTNGFVYITFDPQQVAMVNAKLYDASGRLVKEIAPEIISPSLASFDLYDVAKGNYILFLPGIVNGVFEIEKL